MRMDFLRFFVVLGLLIFPPIPAMAQASPKLDPVTSNLEFWLPPDFQSGKGPWPLVLFSHGFGGCAKQSSFLTSYLAEHGYIVAAPDHADARPCKSVRAYEMQKDMLDRVPEKPFRFPEQWDEKTYEARRDDMKAALDSILADPQFKGYVDEEHIALLGHSLGGYTALGLAGAWPSWKDKRFKAVVALSPYASPFVQHKTLKEVNVPILYMGGTRDDQITPMLKAANGAYTQSNPPKYFVELTNAGHFSFTQRDDRFQTRINETVLVFLDKYLKGQANTIVKTKDMATYWEQEAAPAAEAP